VSGERERTGAQAADSRASAPAHDEPRVADCLQVSTTCPSRELADRLAAILVEERLAACAQVEGPISSTFHWEGRIDTATEWRCQFKTTRSRLPALTARIEALHSYAVPEILAFPIVGGSPAYLDWIENEAGRK
jgi:periplasmic divalent cation tolerance protein